MYTFDPNDNIWTNCEHEHLSSSANCKPDERMCLECGTIIEMTGETTPPSKLADPKAALSYLGFKMTDPNSISDTFFMIMEADMDSQTEQWNTIISGILLACYTCTDDYQHNNFALFSGEMSSATIFRHNDYLVAVVSLK